MKAWNHSHDKGHLAHVHSDEPSLRTRVEKDNAYNKFDDHGVLRVLAEVPICLMQHETVQPASSQGHDGGISAKSKGIRILTSY